MASRGEGGSGLPTPRRCDTGAPPTPVTTTPWMENALVTKAMMTVPPRMVAPRSNTDLPFKQRCTRQEEKPMQAHTRQPTAEQKQLHDEESSPASKPLPRSTQTCHHIMSLHLRWRGS
jgi:hypothetical protein